MDHRGSGLAHASTRGIACCAANAHRSRERRILLETIRSTSVSVVLEIAPRWTMSSIFETLAGRKDPHSSGRPRSTSLRLAILRYLMPSVPNLSMIAIFSPASSRAAAMFDSMNRRTIARSFDLPRLIREEQAATWVVAELMSSPAKPYPSLTGSCDASDQIVGPKLSDRPDKVSVSRRHAAINPTV